MDAQNKRICDAEATRKSLRRHTWTLAQTIIHNEHVEPNYEHPIIPNTPEWHALRGMCLFTASAVGGLCGVGSFGKPGPLMWVRYKRLPEFADEPAFKGNAATEQGHYWEPVIRHMHQDYLRRATGDDTLVVREDNLWTVQARSLTKPLGATPDAVVDALPEGSPDADWGTLNAEYKAPVYNIYDGYPDGGYGLKTEHCVQIHIQMGITGRRHSDYVVVCFAKRRATAVRVRFSAVFYKWALQCLRRVQAWYRLPLVHLKNLNTSDPANMMPPPPLHTVEVRPLHMVYPHMLPFEATLLSDEECRMIADSYNVI